MRGGIGWQVNTVFKHSNIFQPGQSKHEAKEAARADLAQQSISATSDKLASRTAIYSYGTAEKYKDTWHSVAEFAKQEFGVKDITKLESHHIQAYLENNLAEGV